MWGRGELLFLFEANESIDQNSKSAKLKLTTSGSTSTQYLYYCLSKNHLHKKGELPPNTELKFHKHKGALPHRNEVKPCVGLIELLQRIELNFLFS